MTEITTKGQIEMMRGKYNAWKNSTARDLWQVYDNYSAAKAGAMEYCKSLCARLNGRDLKIIGFNCMQFSVGFEYPNADTGEVMFAYITRDYDRSVNTNDFIQ